MPKKGIKEISDRYHFGDFDLALQNVSTYYFGTLILAFSALSFWCLNPAREKVGHLVYGSLW